MSRNYLADDDCDWRHPKDRPPPHGTKLLLYMHPHGITVIGEWQNSGAALWAPLRRVPREMKDRLDREMGR